MKIFKFFGFLLWPIALTLTAWVLYQLPISTIKLSINVLKWQDWFNWLLLNGLIICLGVLRWSMLINMLNASINFGRLMCIRQAGQAVSFITPGPQFGGEPLQLFWLSCCGVSLQKALLSLGLDRFFELWINFSMLLLGVLVILISPNNFHIATYQIIGALIFLLIFISAIPLLLIGQPIWLSRFLKKLAEPLTKHWNHPRLLKILNQFKTLKADLRIALKTEKPRLLLALVLSLAGWAALIGELLLLLQFIDVHLNLTELAMLLVAMRLALLLPIPGGLGTLEASVFWSFQLFNLPGSAALALIALMRLRDAVILLIGLGCIRLVGIKRNQQLLSD